MRRVLGVATFGFMGVLVGCSNSSGGGAAGGGSGGSGGGSGSCSPVSPKACFGSCDPCTRITQSQVVAAVGAPVVEEQGSGHGGGCAYENTDSNGLPIVQVGITSNLQDETFHSICDNPAAGTTTTPVSGVGDSACYLSAGNPGPYALIFEKGCWAYQVQVSGPQAQYTETTIEADEKTIALDMLPAL